jgi:hypothetical protein
LASIAQTRNQVRAAQLIAENQEEEDEEVISLSSNMMNSKNALVLDDKTEVQELDKLLESSCINLLHQYHTSLYQKIISPHVLNQIVNTCAEYKVEFGNNCNQDTREIIKTVFDDIKKIPVRVSDKLDKALVTDGSK